jgi:hypothetical protein
MVNLDLRLRQMHAALDNLQTRDFSTVRVYSKTTDDDDGLWTWTTTDFGGNEADVANVADLLVDNIACLKDHLRAWCRANGRPFKGEELINSNRDVAIVHDLWNIRKHAELNRAPRSGSMPQLKNLRRGITSGGGRLVLDVDQATGGFTKPQVSDGANPSLIISGQVVDEHGNQLGSFQAICESAIAAWEATLTEAGVRLPD